MIGRALRAHARSFVGDRVLLWAAVAAFAMSLTVATSIPPELASAPSGVRDALTAPFSAMSATYGAVLAAVYGSFRYTVDRRDGVVAQRLMMQSRWATVVVRVPASAVGGAVVAVAAVVGGRAVLLMAVGDVPPEWSSLGSALALGAAAGLWGLAGGLLVQAHLVALFVVPMSLSGAVLVAMTWREGAVYLPLLAMLEASGFDVAALGIPSTDRLDSSTAVLVTAGWLLLALLVGAVSFMRRDVR